MKGLLLKDLFSVRHYALWYAVVTVACFVVSVFTENVSFMFGPVSYTHLRAHETL